MKRKLRVLQIIGDSKFGGASLVVADLMKMLQGRGLEVTLLATDRQMVDFAQENGFRVWPFKGIQRSINPLIDISATMRLAWALRGKYDIVHTHTTKGGVVGRTAAHMAGIPIVIHTVHGFAFGEFSGRLATSAVCLVEHIVALMCDRVIFVNSFDRLKSVKAGIIPENKAVTVYNGVTEERLKPGLSVNRTDLLKELNLAEDTFLCANVGRLAEQKGLRYLFEALGIVRRKMPELKIHQVMIGQGELYEQSQEWIKEYGIADRVHFLGFRTDALRWTGGADAFVLSSLWEGHSITLLEAMGCSTPIIATDIKGNRESITNEQDGLLVQPCNAQALADGIIRIASNPELARSLARQARETFMKRFTIEIMLENLWSIYDELLRSKNLLIK